MGCGTNIVRGLFFAFNLLFWILGIVVLGIGVYSRVENDTWKELIDSETIFETSNLLIAAGVIVTIIGFLGCCGAIKKYQWMLVTYAIIVLLIFVLEIVAGAYAYSKREKVQEELTKGLTKGLQKNYDEADKANEGVTKAMDWFQQNVKCCGATGPEDWLKSKWYEKKTNKTEKVPKSCCRSVKSGCNINVSWNSQSIWNYGCVARGKDFAKDNLWLIGGVGVGIAIVELFGIGFAFCLCMAFRKDENEVV